MSNLTSSERLKEWANASVGQENALYEIASQLAGIRELMELTANPVMTFPGKGPAKIIPFQLKPDSNVADGGDNLA